MKISETIKDLELCKVLIDKIENKVKEGKLTPTTAHAVVVKINDYLDILEKELEN